MKTEREIRDFLALMAEHDKFMKEQFDEDVRKKFPPYLDLEIPKIMSRPEPGQVNCRCTIIPCTTKGDHHEKDET